MLGEVWNTYASPDQQCQSVWERMLVIGCKNIQDLIVLEIRVKELHIRMTLLLTEFSIFFFSGDPTNITIQL